MHALVLLLIQAAGAHAGVYSTCIPTGNNDIEDTIAGFLLNMDKSVDVFATKVRADPKLAKGFNAFGLSQGNNLIHGYQLKYTTPSCPPSLPCFPPLHPCFSLTTPCLFARPWSLSSVALPTIASAGLAPLLRTSVALNRRLFMECPFAIIIYYYPFAGCKDTTTRRLSLSFRSAASTVVLLPSQTAAPAPPSSGPCARYGPWWGWAVWWGLAGTVLLARVGVRAG